MAINKNKSIRKLKSIECPNCGCPMPLKKGHYGLYYFCIFGCQIYHRAHPNGDPVGIPADKETRQLRKQLHKLFEDYYQVKLKINKNKAYHLFAQLLNIPMNQCHIGLFNKEQCTNYINILNDLL